MKNNQETTPPDMGVVIGRFQVPEPTAGHDRVIQIMRESHRRRMILVGSPGEYCTSENPLTFEMRMAMLQKQYPGILILPLDDVPSHMGGDAAWSDSIDRAIQTHSRGSRAWLYGGRDSFGKHYSGVHTVIDIQSEIDAVSGTDTRANVASEIIDTLDGRKGVIWATQNMQPWLQQDVAKTCAWCGGEVDNLTGNPFKWAISAPHSKDAQHYTCIQDALQKHLKEKLAR